MPAERRSRQWWRKTVERYRKSGMTAEVFAQTRGVNVSTLRWWASELGREESGSGTARSTTRSKASSEQSVAAEQESEPIVPLQVQLSGVVASEERRGPKLEVVVGDELVVRLFDGAEPGYVADLLKELRAEPC